MTEILLACHKKWNIDQQQQPSLQTKQSRDLNPNPKIFEESENKILKTLSSLDWIAEKSKFTTFQTVCKKQRDEELLTEKMLFASF